MASFVWTGLSVVCFLFALWQAGKFTDVWKDGKLYVNKDRKTWLWIALASFGASVFNLAVGLGVL